MNKQSKWIAAGLIFLSAIFVAIIFKHIPLQLDLSAEKNYTLSKGSKALIKKIEEPITLDFYYSKSVEGLPNQFKNFAERIQVLLHQYERTSNGMLIVHFIDPKPDTKEEEAAIRAGIANNQLPSGESFFFGLVAIQADQEESIEVFSQQREPFIEYDISKLITQVQRLHLPKLGIITSLPIEGSQQQPQFPGMPQQQGGEPEWVFLTQLKEQFDVSVLQTSAESIDSTFDVLMVIHPMGLSDKLQFAIDQFLLSGKPVFLALDPSSVAQKQSMPPQMAMMGRAGPTNSDLPRLLNAWGIEFDTNTVVGDIDYAARVSTGRGQAAPYPAWQMTDNINKEVPVVAPLNQMLIVEGGSFSLKEESQLELIPLLQTSSNSTGVPGQMLAYSPPQQVLAMVSSELEKTPGKPLNTAAIIRGAFTTAFPEGAPEETEESAEQPEEKLQSENLQKGESQLVLIADSDFLYDQFSVERMNFLGNTMLRPLNDNLNFVLNITEYLSGSEDLLALRGRGTSIRPFEKVQELEIIAQARFQQELDAVNQQLSEVQQQLSDLQSKQSDNGVLVAGPELQKAIEEYQNEQANAVAKRRDIRKHLREDIEALDRNLAVFNLLFVPAILCVFGVVFFIRRNRSTR